MMAIDENNIVIAEHVSSDHEWGKKDMGIGSQRKHEDYKKYFPNGYELTWIERN